MLLRAVVYVSSSSVYQISVQHCFTPTGQCSPCQQAECMRRYCTTRAKKPQKDQIKHSFLPAATATQGEKAGKNSLSTSTIGDSIGLTGHVANSPIC